MNKTSLLILVFAFTGLSFAAGQDVFSLTRKVRQYDRGDTSKPIEKAGEGRISGRVGYLEYDVTVPRSSWYTFSVGAVNAWVRYELFVDDAQMTSWATRGESRKGKTFVPLANLYLKAGSHRIRLQRMGWPGVFPGVWQLTESRTPRTSIQGRLISRDVVRTGGNLTLQLSGGQGEPSQYRVMTRKAGQSNWVVAKSVSFPATSLPLLRQVSIPCNDEGTFSIRLFSDQTKLPPSVLQMDAFAVVDTRESIAEAGPLKTSTVHTIDCVKQTRNGTALTKGVDFWEAKGESRITTSSAGTYRESAPSRLDSGSADVGVKSWGVVSGIAYAIDVVEKQKLYLAEITYPDDDRRTVTVGVYANNSKNSSAHGYSPMNSHAGYETGDWYPLSKTMKTLRIFFYADDRPLRLQFMSFGGGLRAAVSKIKISQVIGGYPAGPPSRPDGRQVINWFEEMNRWQLYFKSTTLNDNGFEADFVGIDRWLRFARYHGYTAVNPTELIYGAMSYRSKKYNFFYDAHYNAPRINALMCEKYGMKYIPQFHVRHPHSWFETRVMSTLTNHPDNSITNRTGQKGAGGPYHPRYNPLHPSTQKYYLSLIKELCDQVGDSPSFAGFSLRISGWYNNAWHAFPSLNWGYGDWMIGEFEKDTGIKVPGAGDARFAARFDFLAKNTEHRERWLAWRAQRMTALYVKIRDLIREYQPGAVLYLDGGVNKKNHTLDGAQTFATTTREGLREVGIDLDLLKDTPGIAYVPGHGFGRPKSFSRYTDQQFISTLLDPQRIALGSGSLRTFRLSNRYFEAHGATPLKALGLDKIKGKSHFASSQAAGRNTLEKLSLLLAEQDTNQLIQGGAQYMFLQDDLCRDWLSNYRLLPALPFERSTSMQDPVALWSRTCDDGFYFYLVNRESYPVECKLSLTGATQVVALNGQRATPLRAGGLSVKLNSFELLAFKAGGGTAITATRVTIPADKLDRLKQQIAFTAALAKRLSKGDLTMALSSNEKADFFKHAEVSRKAFQKQQYWRARVELMAPEMVIAYDKTGGFPEGQYHRNNPRKLDLAKSGMAQLPIGRVILAEQLKVTTAKDGTTQLALTLPHDGLFRINLGVTGKGTLVSAVNGSAFRKELATGPDTMIIPAMAYHQGTIELSLSGVSDLKLYGAILEPVYRNLSDRQWATIGPFKTSFKDINTKASAVKTAMGMPDLPLSPFNLKATYPGAYSTVSWGYPGKSVYTENDKLDFATHNGSLKGDICYAATTITTPEAVSIKVLISTDWWANAYLNGVMLTSERDKSGFEKDGAHFNTWKYTPATLRLKKGKNLLVIKNHGGSAANWVKVMLTATGKLTIAPPK